MFRVFWLLFYHGCLFGSTVKPLAIGLVLVLRPFSHYRQLGKKNRYYPIKCRIKIIFISSLDSRTDLPKVRYATALDWFLLMSFFYCIATLLEFAGVHYFTKVGSGEINALTDDEWEDVGETIEHGGTVHSSRDLSPSQNQLLGSQSTSARKRNSIICPIYNVNVGRFSHYHWFWFNFFFELPLTKFEYFFNNRIHQ